jgi:predicted RNA-binding Zn ribbon-like protein
MQRQAGLAVDLVNLATPGCSRGLPHRPAAGDELVRRFAALLSPAWAAELAAVPDAGVRLEHMAAELRAVFTADGVAQAAAVLNRLLRSYHARPYLTDDVDQPFHLHFHSDAATAVEALGGELATALALVVDTYGQKRFGLCEARNCDRGYVDLTRNGSRRYCSDACRARAKMAAYRSRQATTR